ncbi:MAG: cytochrome ubiquinol oxidase subunit I [Deltaproteobacteria bacterium]|nr:cytochrome ubiquinol oxidase subunit I [Deltaproteobacteria bacterium]
MDDLLAARLQMAFTLGFHIIFASIGIAMPFLMAASHRIFLKRGSDLHLRLTKAWSKGVAIFFAVGAVSGTALSFELGLLWPEFMKYAGPIIGMPFSWEGAAFFLEAIALGIYLYGWGRVPPKIHWWTGIVVGLSGVASAFFVICANSWMNNPSGFDWNEGSPINIDPWAAMFNEGAFLQGLHMVLAAFEAVGFGVAGLHALLYLRTKHDLHREALKISFVIGAVAAIAQPIVGDFTAKMTAQRQPLKLAAMEGLFETQRGAPLVIGGLPSQTERRVDYAIEIPKFLSFLAYGDFNAEVKGLLDFPEDEWPPVLIVHLAFQIMVGIGMLLAALGALGLLFLWRAPAAFLSKTFQSALILCTPLGFIAIEAGWCVTEVGRQPWIIYGLLKTSEAVTPRPGVLFTLITYAVLYTFLWLIVIFLMKRQVDLLHSDLNIRERPK